MSRILRKGQVVREKTLPAREANMSHTIADQQYRRFRHDGFRRPGDLRSRYSGGAALCIAEGVKPGDGGTFEIAAAPFGAPLRNPPKGATARRMPDGARGH